MSTKQSFTGRIFAVTIDQLLVEVDLKIVLSSFGVVGALMIALVGFNPAGAGDGRVSLQSQNGGFDFVIVGHGGGLGPCGGVEPTAKTWFGLFESGC